MHRSVARGHRRIHLSSASVTHHVVLDRVVKSFLPHVLRVLVRCTDDVAAGVGGHQEGLDGGMLVAPSRKVGGGLAAGEQRQGQGGPQQDRVGRLTQSLLVGSRLGLIYLRPPYSSTFREYFLTASSVVEVISSVLLPGKDHFRRKRRAWLQHRYLSGKGGGGV